MVKYICPCLDDAQLGEVGPGNQVLEPVGLGELCFQSGVISLQTVLSSISFDKEKEFIQKHSRGLNRVPARTYLFACLNQLSYRCLDFEIKAA